VTFARSTDYPLITNLLTEPRCWRRMTGGQPERAFQAGPGRGLDYIVAWDQGAPAAVFLLLAANGDEAEVHFCFAPDYWGKTEAIAREFLAWAWRNTGYRRLLGPVPLHNRLALRLARAVGFHPAPEQRHDLLLLEITRPLTRP
jgi:RimJ/RimL family protein N-acetyltransferase